VRGSQYQQAHSAAGEAGTDGPSFNLTDLGNAERLVLRHGRDLRYVHPWGKWLAWDGQRWAVDATGEVERRAVETVASIYTEAASADDKDERKAISRHAERSESRSRIDAMISLARSRPGIPVMPEDLDADLWALNAANGTIDLRTGELRPHERSDLITKLIEVEYDSGARAPIYERFLERILPDEAVRSFLQRAVGYSATGVIREEVLPILHGPGANGKTTLTGVLMEALGDYAIQAAPDLLMLKKGAHPTELADLFGARFVVAMKTEEGRRLAESLVKHITGRDQISARRMREDFWRFQPTHTVFLGTNHRPEVRGTDHAIWRRLKLIPFGVTIPEAEQDKKLSEKLSGELSGILAWIVQGCLRYQRDGLGEPDQVRDATTGYRSEMDTLSSFFEDRCVIHPKAEVPATPLYKEYQAWCAENGETDESQRRFGGRLQERGFQNFRYTAGPNKQRKGWRGIGLRDDRDDGDPPGGNNPSESSGRVNDQTQSSANKGDQDAHNTRNSYQEGSPGERTVYERSPSESPIDKGNTANNGSGGELREPKSDITEPIEPREGVMPKKGSHRSLRSPDGVSEGSQAHVDRYGNLTRPDDGYPSVEALFADPPEWLTSQLGTYRQDPEKHLRPLCSAVAIDMFRIEDGKIVEHWGHADDPTGFLRQPECS